MPEPFAILKITREERTQLFGAEAVLIGSCFQVAPTLVVTCGHVVSDAFPGKCTASSLCVVTSSIGEAFLLRMADLVRIDEVRDMALFELGDLASFNFPMFGLALQSPAPNQKCILRGYVPPKSIIQGYAARGMHFGKRWHFDIRNAAVTFDSSVIEVKRTTHTQIRSQGESRKGISGAPLIDVATGLVMGMQTTGSASAPFWWTGAIEPETVAVGADEIAAFIGETRI